VPIIPSKYVCFLILVEAKIVHTHLTHPAFVGIMHALVKMFIVNVPPFICSHNHHHCHHSFDFQLTEVQKCFKKAVLAKI
jgi:hypothetical protein